MTHEQNEGRAVRIYTQEPVIRLRRPMPTFTGYTLAQRQWKLHRAAHYLWCARRTPAVLVVLGAQALTAWRSWLNTRRKQNF